MPIAFLLSSVLLLIELIHRVATRADSGRCNLTIPLFVDVFVIGKGGEGLMD
jgi:hypothetical protein